ncbi:MAG TPA: helix-turn-helix domain-containing protein, partial [Ktedonobacteraceae bacterium]|nr:helix-turn-helix domain-containing protein [Ktedonobacteraceae bacterium]
MNGVQSVERALDLMECLGRASGWLGISELSSATGQPVGTIHRLLKTLVAREYVVRDSRTRRYAIGPAFRMMVGVGMQGPDWAKIGTPILRELAYLSGETANLAVIDRDRAVYVAQAQPARMVRMFTEIGNRVH